MAGEIQATAPSGGPSFVRIPMGGRKGAGLYATVDAADAPLVEPFRWHINTDGYAIRTVDQETGRKELMARRILGLEPGDGLETDHISRDRLDNRRLNLRVVTHAENSQNRTRTDGALKARGVSVQKGKKARPYKAYGCVAGKQVHLGFYDAELEAARAAEAWRRIHLPFAAVDVSLDPLPPCNCKECRNA